MKHQDFIYAWTDKYYNYDTAYGPECVDLFKGYCRDVLGETILVGAGAAINYWNNLKEPFNKKWRKIKQGEEKPKQGDIVFFDTSLISFGHVGIVHSVKDTKISIFDQIGNGEPVGGEKPCKIREYPYNHVLGYWTLRKPIIMNKPPVLKLFKQYPNPITINSCTIFAIIHMLLYNNIVKNDVGIGENEIAIFCQKLQELGILTPFGADIDKALDYFLLNINKKKYVLENMNDIELAMAQGFACLAIVENDNGWWADQQDGAINSPIEKYDFALSSHAVIIAKEGDKYFCYDSNSQVGKYEISEFWNRYTKQIWFRMYTIK